MLRSRSELLRRRVVTVAGAVALTAASAAPAAAASGGALSAAAVPSLVQNAGQSDEAVRYEARGSGGSLFVTAQEVVLARPPAVVRLRFVGADRRAALRPVGRRDGVVNHAVGRRRDRWQAGLPRYAGVVFGRLYPGIDARHDLDAETGGPWVHSSFVLAPRADPRRLRWRYEGAAETRVDFATGGLSIVPAAGGAALTQPAPRAWQQVDGHRVPVGVRYAIARDRSVSLVLGSYDRSHGVRIGSVSRGALARPRVARAAAGLSTVSRSSFAFSTFLGGSKWDEAYDVAVDRRGGSYVTGLTFSADFPRRGTRPSSFGGVFDAFVARFSPGGKLVYTSYLGGERLDVGHGIAVDRHGNAYVTGRTRSGSFPVRDALQPTLRGRTCQGVRCHDAFVTKLGPRGTIRYSTYLGGTSNEEGWAIAVDRARSAYVTGNTDSTDFPTRRAVQDTNRSRPCPGDLPCPLEVFVTKLTPNGRGVPYSTYLGGARSDTTADIAVDGSGSAHVTGTTRSSDFPTRRAQQGAIRGNACGPLPTTPCLDVFVAKLSAGGGELRYSTYLGGTQSERSGGIALDARGRAHVTGSTQSTDFPTLRAVQPIGANSSCRREPPAQELCDDAFVTGLSLTGRRLTFSTYLGGNAADQGLGISIGRRGAIHVAGATDSRTFPTRNAFQSTLGGAIDAFVARLSAGGRRLEASSYLGGSENERANAIATVATGGAVVAGRTESADFPVARAARRGLAGDYDAFVTKLR